MRVAILGAGAWGTALGISLASRHQVSLWSRHQVHSRTLAADRVNARYLPDVAIPGSVLITSELKLAIENGELIVVAVPTAALRETMRLIVSAGSTAGDDSGSGG